MLKSQLPSMQRELPMATGSFTSRMLQDKEWIRAMLGSRKIFLNIEGIEMAQGKSVQLKWKNQESVQ